MAFALDLDDEAALINLRYALSDALELCGQVASNRPEVAVVAEIIKAANIQVMWLLKSPKAEFALERLQDERVPSAA